MLSPKLLNQAERILSSLGVWPNLHNGWITITNIILFVIFSVFVFVKNITNPQAESIETAFTYANGGNLFIIYLAIMLMRKDKFQKIIEFNKKEVKCELKNEESKIIKYAEKEYRTISTAFLIFVPSAVLSRLVILITEYAYSKASLKNK